MASFHRRDAVDTSDHVGIAAEVAGHAEIWEVDFEIRAAPGEISEPVCLVAWELRSGRKDGGRP